MDPYFFRNREAIEALNVLADKTRLDMLLLMKQYSPKGLTASDLSAELGKSIPTILWHLEKLERLKLAYFEMEPITDGKRKVKHWKLPHQKIHIEIDIENLAFTLNDIEQRIFVLFEEEKGAGGAITANFGEDLTVDRIESLLSTKYPNLTEQQAQTIKDELATPSGVSKYVESWVYQNFTDSGGNLQLQFFGFGRYFALGEKLRGELWTKFANSPDFNTLIFPDTEGNPAPGIVLRPNILKKLRKKP